MKCAQLPVTCTKEERISLHHLKMAMKRENRQQQEPTGYGYPIRENKAKREEVEGNRD